jgi:hypothetical protein
MGMIKKIFKTMICFPIMIIFWILSHPINLMFLLIPEGIYWMITGGRSLLEDGELFSNWTLDLKK